MENKIWFITGISSGLGKALADLVMSKGDFLIGTFRQESQVAAFNKKNKDKGEAILLDITDEKNVEQSIKEVISKYKKIDVLVNNAGVGFIGAIEEATIEEVRKIFEINLFGTLKLTQTVLPFMRKNKKGHIVQISSQSGIKAEAGFGIYNSSKFAIEGFSEALAHEVNPLGIKVTIVEPGPFRTKFAGSSLQYSKKIISDYDESAGLTRARLNAVDGKQEGDPLKAAEAIYDIVNSSSSTLRLPLGKIALKSIETKLKSVESDLETNRKIAENTVY